MLLPLLQRLDRRALWRRGFVSDHRVTSAGRLHALRRPARAPGLPPLVMVHGISSAGVEFRPVLERVAARWDGPIVVPDLPAHGFSEVPAAGLQPESLLDAVVEGVDGWLDEADTRGALIYGNSLGGLAAIRYTLASPDRVGALLLNSPGGAGVDEDALQAFLGRFGMPRHRDAVAFVDRIHVRAPWYRHLIAGDIARRFRAPVMRDFLATLRAEHLLTPAQLAAIAHPVLLVWGRDDHLMPAEHLAFFRTHLPGHAVVEEPEGIGHCPHLDTPGRIADRILAWAAEHTASAPRAVAGA